MKKFAFLKLNIVVLVMSTILVFFFSQCSDFYWEEYARTSHVREVRTHNIEKVINIIPPTMSDEKEQDAEPSIAVNPLDFNKIDISSLSFGDTVITMSVPTETTPSVPTDTLGWGPYFNSDDAGDNWNFNIEIPLNMSHQETKNWPQFNDINIAFGKKTGIEKFYAGILTYSPNQLKDLELFSNNNSLTSGFQSLLKMDSIDYPMLSSSNDLSKTEENLFLSANDYKNSGELITDHVVSGQTAFLVNGEMSTGIPGVFSSARTKLEQWHFDVTLVPGCDGADICTSANDNGVTYAAFSRWKSHRGDHAVNVDIILTRDDIFGANRFKSLEDTGKIIATNIMVPIDIFLLGRQKINGGNVAIASNPENSGIVYIAYGKWQCSNCEESRISFKDYDLILAMSRDSGKTWTDSLYGVANATNPALSVNSLGETAFMYQQYIVGATGDRWETHVKLATDGVNFNIDDTLCSQPDTNTRDIFTPFLSDYGSMLTVDNDFYGTFSSPNIPDSDYFPSGIKYQRKADFMTHKLINSDGITNNESISVDPYFFKLNTDVIYVRSLNLCDRVPDICVGVLLLRKRWDLICRSDCPDFSIFRIDIHKFFEVSAPERIQHFNRLMGRNRIFYANILIKDFKPNDWWIEIYNQNQTLIPYQLTNTSKGTILTYQIDPISNAAQFYTFYIASTLDQSPRSSEYSATVKHTKRPMTKFCFK